ncbi:carbohydrate kinase family protein [Alicyclobacillus sp. ALC3]|uniref:carbohydrate kinase family protein n=1 Tax=Alicyclobacillus sp. ALC3 TaxID=2796143 RepID=UPI0023785523|nr:carbohydrate kinase family protein [Alicyclobacillus sp. ALC3]WDL95790.1 carbohydrate kinase family protein [Alicyclobacillus sp. ALC3]
MHRHVVVVGGANIDVKARILHETAFSTSNPGTVWRTSGGVGRNIAENLAVLGTTVRLVSPLGADESGQFIRRRLEEVGVDTTYLVELAGQSTGMYVAVINRHGELEVAVSDMTVLDHFTPDQLRKVSDAFVGAGVVSLDANLSTETLRAAIDMAEEVGAVTVADPVSVSKSRHLLPVLQRLTLVTPSRDELAAMTGMTVESQMDVAAAVQDLHSRGVRHVVATLGDEGVCYLTGDEKPVFVRPQAAHVEDVTGAGDAFTAGCIDAMLRGQSIAQAAVRGQALAAQIVASKSSVLMREGQ